MRSNDVERILAGLKGFQRDAVDHIVDRLYGPEATSGRFLVADETGLGKSIIARGVVAATIAELQDAAHVDRIDVVYICSSTDLAKQNLHRLNVTGDPLVSITSRLTLLALDSRRLASDTTLDGKKVNLVSFTPGTSFEMGWQTGSRDERQLLHILLNGITPSGSETERASALFFQGQVRKLMDFQAGIERMRELLGAGPDAVILREFCDSIEDSGLRREFDTARDRLNGLDVIPDEMKPAVKSITSRLRGALAKASVESLEPDLVILDEFQRFRHLIDPASDNPASELAHHLFNYRHAKVLLLSATPYKPYTTVAGDSEDDHYQDFMTTLSFLTAGDPVSMQRIRTAFRGYRQAVVVGANAAEEAIELRNALIPFMSRSERPRLEEGRDLLVRRVVSRVPTPDDLRGYAALQAFAHEVDSPVSLDYWKSIPYFASFMDGYRPGERAREAMLPPPRKAKAAFDAATPDRPEMAAPVLATPKVPAAAVTPALAPSPAPAEPSAPAIQEAASMSRVLSPVTRCIVASIPSTSNRSFSRTCRSLRRRNSAIRSTTSASALCWSTPKRPNNAFVAAT
jgi:hypothetical protein